MLPNFFILGAGRSGTTALAGLLREHSQVFIPEIKEPSFFAESFQWVRSPVRYADVYSEATQPARGDASHIYLEDPASARTLLAFAPDARFIVVLRNPAERARALYSFTTEHGHEILPTFESALAAEDRRYSSARFRRTCPGSFWNFMYYRSGLFAEQLDRFFALFPRDRFFVTTLDRLVDDTAATVGAMCEFLDITPMRVAEMPRDGSSKGVRSTTAQVAARKYLRPLAKRGIPGAETSWSWLQHRNQAAAPTLDARTKSNLLLRFEPDLRRLEEITGISDMRR